MTPSPEVVGLAVDVRTSVAWAFRTVPSFRAATMLGRAETRVSGALKMRCGDENSLYAYGWTPK